MAVKVVIVLNALVGKYAVSKLSISTILPAAKAVVITTVVPLVAVKSVPLTNLTPLTYTSTIPRLYPPVTVNVV